MDRVKAGQRSLTRRSLLVAGWWLAALVCVGWGLPAGFARAAESADFDALPVSGMVTMIDLGAQKCIPCKQMAPILKRVEKAYRGRAAVVFIDVWVHREQARRFRVHAIPTQIFFTADGQEVFRHVGFLGEEQIVQALEKLGVAR